MIRRIIEKSIEEDFNKNKVIVVLGARQVGKTTLFESIMQDKKNVFAFNCDNYDDRLLLTDKTSTELKQLVEGYSFVVIDEAQKVKDIGLTLKMFADMKLSTQILVTGSSSLELSNKINEPATGRLFEYQLFPISMQELVINTSEREEKRLLEQRLIYGFYPEIITHPKDAKRLLVNLANNYLYRDLLEYKGIKKPDVLQRLVRLLALQISSEVNYNELSKTLGIDKETVENYIDLLEKCFVVFRLPSYSRNQRSEIKKGKKIYFYDNGIRNALISNFAPLELRADVGALWENMLVSDRRKRNAYNGSYAQCFFWRTKEQKEIDYLEEEDGVLTAYEFKWNKQNAKPPKSFITAYPNSKFEVISKENYMQFLIK